MLEEFKGDILVCRVIHSQLQRNGQHVKTKHTHPASAIALFDVTTGWGRCAPVEDSYIIKPKEAALKHIQSFRIFAINPPCKIEHQFVEHTLEKSAVTTALLFLVDLVNTPNRPSQD